MNKTFALFLILFGSLCASKTYLRGSGHRIEDFSLIEPSTLSLSSVEQISLKRSEHGFLVSIDLLDGPNTNLTTNTADMILALYADNTLLFNYNCTDYKSCHIDSAIATEKNISFPYFTTEGSYASVDVSLSSGSSKLTSDALVNIVGEDYSNNNNTGPYGYIGMGLSGNASSNFVNQPSFSIFLTSDGESGQLLFTPNMSLVDSSTPQATLSADNSWHINGVDSLDIGSTFNVEDTSLIFDLNSDVIGLPLDIYNQVLEALESQFSLECPSNRYNRPICSNYKLDKTLPAMKINIGGQSISIPSSIYVQGGDADVQTYATVLNIKALSSNLTGDSYVTSTYENYIVLGYPILAYYYTVFDGDSNTITLYTADHSEDTSYILYIIIGWFGFFIVVAACYYCYMRAKMARQRNAENQNSIRDPLVVHSDQVEEVNDQVPNQEQESA